MIYKSYVLENNINSLNEKIILFYGENLGLKNDLKGKIIFNNKNSEVLRFTQEELTKNNRALINEIQKSRLDQNGLIINAGGYTHTSVSIHDALKILIIPIIELHISNIYNREDFRHKSLISKVAKGVICGFGEEGYIMALEAMKKYLEK